MQYPLTQKKSDDIKLNQDKNNLYIFAKHFNLTPCTVIRRNKTMNSTRKEKYSAFCSLLNETLKYELRLILPPGDQAVIPLLESPRGEISRDTIEKCATYSHLM